MIPFLFIKSEWSSKGLGVFSLSKLQQDRALDLISQMEQFLGPLCLFQLPFASQMGFCVSFLLKKKALQEWNLLLSATQIPFVLRFTQDLGKQDALHLLPVSKPKCLPGAPCCVPWAQPARAPAALRARAGRAWHSAVGASLSLSPLASQSRVWTNGPPWALCSLPQSAPHHPQAGLCPLSPLQLFLPPRLY